MPLLESGQQLPRAVGGGVIDDDQLPVGPLGARKEAFEAEAIQVSVVEGDDDDGETGEGGGYAALQAFHHGPRSFGTEALGEGRPCGVPQNADRGAEAEVATERIERFEGGVGAAQRNLVQAGRLLAKFVAGSACRIPRREPEDAMTDFGKASKRPLGCLIQGIRADGGKHDDLVKIVGLDRRGVGDRELRFVGPRPIGWGAAQQPSQDPPGQRDRTGVAGGAHP